MTREAATVRSDAALAGRRIIVTRAAEQAPDLVARLVAHGAEVAVLAAIQIEPATDYTPLDQAIAALDTYDWVLFTSVNGVRAFAERLRAGGRDWAGLGRARVGAIGPGTAAAIAERHQAPDLVPDEYVAEGLLAGLGNVAGQRVLLPRADLARPDLAAELRVRGAEVDEVVAYRTVPVAPDADAVRRALIDWRPDAITFTSSSTVRGFVAGLAAAGLAASDIAPDVAIACIGPITAATARAHGLEPSIVAGAYTLDGLVAALIEFFARPASTREGVCQA